MILAHFRIFFRKMTSFSTASLTPVGVRGMKVLDREKFLRHYKVPVLKVNAENLSKIISLCKKYFLKLENFKPVQSLVEDKEEYYTKCIYFNPEKVSTFTNLFDIDHEVFTQQGITENNFDIKEIQLKYENWTFDSIFKAVLPENEEIVSSFSQIGHIIHLNLRDHLLDYRYLIGQVLLDKIKTCKTVVNKSNIIDNTYRNFSMEILAGDEDFLVTVKENNCKFQFDFSKVYWNPRLGKEHERILNFIKSTDVLFDVFCGVGPFAVPAAKRKAKVFANDLNPDSYHWLKHNAKNNKVKEEYFKPYNQDGKDFICHVFKHYIIDLCSGKEKVSKEAKIHITMNLPAMAVEFLKYFNGLIEDKEILDKLNNEIVVYTYCFAVGEEPASVAKKMVIDNIGCDVSNSILDVFHVRNVSPKKEMMRVTFKLTKEVLLGIKNDLELSEPPEKKVCVEV
ncbi:hypothetical protein K1T71_004690 [Dendrolimus kikuchii]|uniref:Uncharacterized protein n=1 Tax=Dendrolimus kikuchii TaxID=765133 RepID=A0ACC1D8M5_9NEOP|nr:hypothetical protein K1T71_004690 [Dendrolimus kikuchii]